MLSLKNFSLKYQEVLIKEASLSLPMHGLIGFLAPNATGKSSFFCALLGLKNYDGEIVYKNTSLQKVLKTAERAKVMSYFDSNTDFDLNLLVNEVLSLSVNACAQLAAKIKTVLNINALAHKKLCTLSSGQLARVALTRTLQSKVPIVILDEPLNYLEPRYKIDLLAFLQKEAQKRLILFSAHTPNEIKTFVTHTLLLHQKRLTLTEGFPSTQKLCDLYNLNLKEAVYL
tara:strand:+ start:78 stop:764 length:687 start_codon:yes stop_codon:yes gene_type:complete